MVDASTQQAPAQPQGVLSLQTIAMPADTNWYGDIFGGWLVSQMDLAVGAFCRLHSKGRVATVAMSDIVFVQPVKVGDILACYTSMLKVGRTSMHVQVQVWNVSENQVSPVKVTEGVFVFVALDEHGVKRAL